MPLPGPENGALFSNTEADTMNCPYCGKEMQAGYIPNGGQPVQWIPAGERPSFFSFSAAKNAIRLVKQFAPIRANGYKAQAYCCTDCKIVIAQTE